jgi:hypothetical protein
VEVKGPGNGVRNNAKVSIDPVNRWIATPLVHFVPIDPPNLWIGVGARKLTGLPR